MELRNIEKAKSLIPQLQTLEMAKKMLSEENVSVTIETPAQSVILPKQMRLNVLNIVNCEYEITRKEVTEL